MEENKTYRIRTKVGDDADKVIQVKLDQHYDNFEILSLKIDQTNNYKTYESDYGVVVGRVLANGGFGIPNAKVSIFIESDDTDTLSDRILYPYKSLTGKNADGVRYNLLTDFLDKACYQNVGTFPNKRLVLDNDDVIDIFDKYYRYTTVTNNAGDYMIFGVPTGSQRLHVDIDLSDIGMLSQRPRDMIYKGYDVNLFDSPNKFKRDTNLNSLAQIISQDLGLYVYPYWGDTSDDSDNIAVTRADINIDYKFEPTCVFMGSIVTDTGSNAIGKNCTSTENVGKMSELIAGEGSIEMIRKTIDGRVEEFQVKGNRVIDGDGVWCYQIPMNLDYIMTDEFGNIVPSDNPNKGIPTRTRVRFRISIDDAPEDNTARKRCRYLVPNNPRLDEELYPNFTKTKEVDYEFGTKTKNENYRDLLWNKVYTVKNYVPRLQKNRKVTDRRHTGIKLINHYDSNNPMPYNNVDIKLSFTYRMLCVVFKIFINLVQFLNQILTALSLAFCSIYSIFDFIADKLCFKILGVKPLCWMAWPFRQLANLFWAMIVPCVGLSSDMCGDNTTHNYTFFPGCGNLMFTGAGAGKLANCIRDKTRESLKKREAKAIKNGEIDKSETTEALLGGTEELYNCVETALAEDNDSISLNFQNDWINGALYAPMWFRKITKKKTYFFGIIRRRAKDQWCEGEKNYTRKILRVFNPCSPIKKGTKTYQNIDGTSKTAYYMNFSDDKRYKDSCRDNCHRATQAVNLDKGLIVKRETMLGQDVYYYKPVEYGKVPSTVSDNSDDYAVDEKNGSGSVKILFATDIVLLGSLNDCDIHGVPQFFKSLESTTFQIPPNILFVDNEVNVVMEKGGTGSGKDDDPDGVNVKYEVVEHAVSEMTGMDWGNFNEDICGKWNDSQDSGLFYSIGCNTIKMKPKSCVNMTRICEFGVSLDETKAILSVDNDGQITSEDTPMDDAIYQTIVPDGFISKDELYNEDERSLFATLNVNGLSTKRNPENGLMEYDFRHIVTNNFDNSLYAYMSERQRKCTKSAKFNYLLEEFSSGYYGFRMGRNPYFYDKNHKFPRYENSFYFYFGLHPGKTAIDKFNSQFISNCANDGEDVSPISIETVPNSWCGNMFEDYDGYVVFDLSAVELPCDIIIRRVDDTGVEDIIINDNSAELFYISNSEVQELEDAGYVRLTGEGLSNGIANGVYEVILTDNAGEIIMTSFTMKPKILKTYIVPTDFYEPDNILMKRFKSKRSDIASDETCLLNCNNVDFTINSTREIGGTIAILKPYDEDTGDMLDYYKIEIVADDMDGVVFTYIKTDGSPDDGGNQITMLRDCDDFIIVGVPKGNENYTITITQLCLDKEAGEFVPSSNVYTETVRILEKSPYKLFINGTVDYDVIKHWKSGFKATVNASTKEPNIVTDGSISSKWWHMSNPENYLWCFYQPYIEADEYICEMLKAYDNVLAQTNDGGQHLIDQGHLNTNYMSMRNEVAMKKHFMYRDIEAQYDSEYPENTTMTEIDIEETISYIMQENIVLTEINGGRGGDNSFAEFYFNNREEVDGEWETPEHFRDRFYNLETPEGKTLRAAFAQWVVAENKKYETGFEIDEYDEEKSAYLDLIDINNDIIEMLTDVLGMKTDFINSTKSAFQLNCAESYHSIFFTVQTKDKPVYYHGVYRPEMVNDDGFYTLEEKHIYTNDGDSVDTITIPTITHKGSERFGNNNSSYSIDTNLCQATDNISEYKDKRKLAYFIATVNSRGKTIPNDAKYSPYDENDCGNGDYENVTITEKYFGYHIVDKIFENRFMMWSYFDSLPYYQPMKNGCIDEDKAGVSICMNGIFASKIFNGNAKGYREVYVKKMPITVDMHVTTTEYGDLSETEQGYYEKYYHLTSDTNYCSDSYITEEDWEDLEQTEKSNYEEIYVRTSNFTPSRTISKEEYDNLPTASEQAEYEKSYETVFEEQQFTPFELNIYTGREDGETDADVEDKMPTVRYVVGEKLSDGSDAPERNFDNFRVTSLNEKYNNKLWALYTQQYASVNKRNIELVLIDENQCQLVDELDGRMKVVLSEDSVNLCSTNNKNHRDGSKFNVKVENPNGEDVRYFVFTTDETAEHERYYAYPLNYAQDYDECSTQLLCRKSKYDMGWNSSTNENDAVFGRGTEKNLFSYFSNPVYEDNSKYAKIGDAEVRRALKSKYIDPNSDKELKTEGWGNTGEFEMERHDRPYFVVAITDNNCRAISPVYDYSYVCARLIFGVVYTKQETTDEFGNVNGYEYVESHKMTFDVANAVRTNCITGNSLITNGCVEKNDILYYFYYYPYSISFTIKLDDVSTVSGEYIHVAYRLDENGYQLFDMDDHAYDKLMSIYKGSNHKVGKNIRNNTVIEAWDYTGLRHIVDWRGCRQMDANYGCGEPYVFKTWVTITWVTNGGMWVNSQDSTKYVDAACGDEGDDCGYYGSDTTFTKTFVVGDTYNVCNVGKLERDDCDNISQVCAPQSVSDSCNMGSTGFIGWSTSYDSMEVITNPTDITITGDKNESMIYYAVWACDFVNVQWKDCNDNLIKQECVRKGIIIPKEDMPESPVSDTAFIRWECDENSEYVEESQGYLIKGDTVLTAVCASACKPEVRFVNCVDIDRHHISLIYMTMTIYEDSTKTTTVGPPISITWAPTRLGSPGNPSLNSEDTYYHSTAYTEGNVVTLTIDGVELDDGCAIYGERPGHMSGCSQVTVDIWNNGGLNVLMPNDEITIRHNCVGRQFKAVLTGPPTYEDCSCSEVFRAVWRWGYDKNQDGYETNDIIRLENYVCEFDILNHPDDPIREGYVFNGWLCAVDNEIYTYDDPYGPVTSSTTDANGNVIFTAQWATDAPVTHTVSFEAEGNQFNDVTVEHGDTVELADIPEDQNVTVPSGKVWDNRWQYWRFDGVSYVNTGQLLNRSQISGLTIEYDTKFIANFADADRFSAIFTVNGTTIKTVTDIIDGDMISADDIPDSSDISPYLPQDTLWTGSWTYEMDNNGEWYMGPNKTNSEIELLPITSNVRFTAILDQTYTVTFAIGNNIMSEYTQTINAGDNATAPTVEQVKGNQYFPEHNSFEGSWRVSGTTTVYTETDINTTLSINSDYDFVAVLLADYEVNWRYPEGVTTDKYGNALKSDVSQKLVSGTRVTTPSNSELEDYAFMGFDLEGDDSDTLTPINTEIEVVIDTVYDGVWDNLTKDYFFNWVVYNHSRLTINGITVYLYAVNQSDSTQNRECEAHVVTGGGFGTNEKRIGKSVSIKGLPNCTYIYALWAKIDYAFNGNTYQNVEITKSHASNVAYIDCDRDNHLSEFPNAVCTINYSCITQNTSVSDINCPDTLLICIFDGEGAPTGPFTVSYYMDGVDISNRLVIDPPNTYPYGTVLTVESGRIPNNTIILNATGNPYKYAIDGWKNNVSPEGRTVIDNASYTMKLKLATYSATFVWQKGDKPDVIVSGIEYGSTVPSESIPTAADAPNVSGWEFTGWTPNPQTTTITQSQTFLGQWSEVIPDNVTVTFRVQEENKPNVYWDFAPVTVQDNAPLPANVVPSNSDIVNKTGNTDKYEFDSWQGFASGQTPAGSTISGNTTFIAYVKLRKYTVTFVNGNSSESDTYDYGTTINMPVNPTQQYMTFGGWSCDSDGLTYEYGDTFVVTEDTTFTAIWKATIKYKVVDNNTNEELGFVTSKEKLVAVPYTIVSADIPTNAELLAATQSQNAYQDFDFEEDWSSQPGNPLGYEVQRNVTFIALMFKKVYNVTFDPNNGSQTTTITPKPKHGDTITLMAAPSREGYTFNGWKSSINNQTYNANASYTVTANVTFTAQWVQNQPNQHTVVFKADGETVGTLYINDGGNININDIPSLSLPSNRRFKGWVIEGQSTVYTNNEIAGWTITESLVLAASIVNVYTVEFYAYDGTNETKIGGTHTVESGNKVTPPSDSTITNAISGINMVRYDVNSPWRIANSDGTFNTYNTVYSTSWFTQNGITSNMKFFLRLAYTVVFDFDQNGVNNVTQSVEQGHHASVPSTPSVENCTFTGWQSSVSGLGTGDNITANVTFTAQWDCQEPQTGWTVSFIGCGGTVCDTALVEDGHTLTSSQIPSNSATISQGTGCLFTNEWKSNTLGILNINSAITKDATFEAICSCPDMTYQPYVYVKNGLTGNQFTQFNLINITYTLQRGSEQPVTNTLVLNPSPNITQGNEYPTNTTTKLFSINNSFTALEIVSMKIDLGPVAGERVITNSMDDYYFVLMVGSVEKGGSENSFTFSETQSSGNTNKLYIVVHDMDMRSDSDGENTEEEI